MTSNKPTVSVLMPVYNCEKYLDLAINSIREQTFRDFEFIIVNDGSTDRSLQIIHKHASEDKRIKLIDQSNGGIVEALNSGLAACTGKYIARMDADDISLPQRLEKQAEYLDQHPETVGLGANVSRKYGSRYMITRGGTGEKKHDQIVDELWRGRGDSLIHPVTMFRKDAIESVGGYRKEAEWAEDLDLYLRLTQIGKLHVIGDTLLLYRQHGNSVNAKKRQQKQIVNWIVYDNAKRCKIEVKQDLSDQTDAKLDQIRRWSSWSHLAANDRFYFSSIYFAAQWIRLAPIDWRSWRMLLIATVKSIKKSTIK